MKPRQPAVFLNSLMLALVILCAATILGWPDSLVVAADGPPREQPRPPERVRPSPPERPQVKAPERPEKIESIKDAAPRNPPPQNDRNPDAKVDASRDPSSRMEDQSKLKEGISSAAANAISPVPPPGQAVTGSIAASPTGSPASQPTVPARLSVRSIALTDPCSVSGYVSMAGKYSGTITFRLVYREEGGSEFVPTSVTWTRTFSDETTVDYSLPSGLPDGLFGDGLKPRSFRIEIVFASPPVANPDFKSGGFACGQWQHRRTATPTPVPSETPVLPAAPTPTATGPVPSETPVCTATALPVSTETALPAATATPTIEPSQTPEPSITPAPTPTVTPTATAIALDWSTRIEPDRAGTANPGADVLYRHTVTNTGNSPDIKEIAVDSSLGWTAVLLADDGASSLPDTDSNGVPDTGLLLPGQSREITVELRVPDDAARAASDSTTVRAFSSADPSDDWASSATDRTTVNGVVTVSLSTTTVSFGGVSPMGAISTEVRDLTSSADESGAYYVKSPAVQVTVNSNAPWTSSLAAEENGGSASTVRISDGDLQWRLVGQEAWTDFASSPSSSAHGGTGVSSYTYDYRLRVLWEDDPGGFSSVVTYDVTQ